MATKLPQEIRRTIFLTIPVFNEARVIRTSLEPLINEGYTIIAVDDGSADDTWIILQDMPVIALHHPINLGQGAALQTGMTYALANGAEYIVHFDADGQHRIEDIDVLVEPLVHGGADVVLGSRFLRQTDTRSVPAMKRLLLRAGVVVNGLLTGMWLTDAHNGFRSFTRAAASRIDLRENRFAHASEILYQIRSAGLRCLERPTTIDYTDYSKEKGQSSWNAIKIVFDVLLRRIFR